LALDAEPQFLASPVSPTNRKMTAATSSLVASRRKKVTPLSCCTSDDLLLPGCMSPVHRPGGPLIEAQDAMMCWSRQAAPGISQKRPPSQASTSASSLGSTLTDLSEDGSFSQRYGPCSLANRGMASLVDHSWRTGNCTPKNVANPSGRHGFATSAELDAEFEELLCRIDIPKVPITPTPPASPSFASLTNTLTYLDLPGALSSPRWSKPYTGVSVLAQAREGLGADECLGVQGGFDLPDKKSSKGHALASALTVFEGHAGRVNRKLRNLESLHRFLSNS